MDSLHETQSTCSCLTGPKKPLEIKDPNMKLKGWPKQACQTPDVIVSATVLIMLYALPTWKSIT